MRITMGMIQRNYKNNMNSTKRSYEKYALRATTTRNFDKPSDDPLNCARSYDVQWDITMNGTYQSNIATIEDTQNTAESTLRSMYDTLKSTISSKLKGITSTSSQDVRNDLANAMLSMRDSIITDMNSSAAGKYLFGGASSDKAPFTVDENGNLLYRGINVDTGENTNGASETIANGDKKIQINFGKSIGAKLNGYKITVSGDDTTSSDSVSISGKTITITMGTDNGNRAPTKGHLQAALKGSADLKTLTGTDLSEISVSGMTYNSGDKLDLTATTSYSDSSSGGITNMVSLNDLANEKVFVDIGLGITKNKDGSINGQSAYNTSLPGISFLGYGKNAGGVSKNLYSILGDMASTLKNTSLNGQDLMDKFDPLENSFNDSFNDFYTQQSNLGTNLDSLQTTDTYLKGLSTNLITEESSIANVSPFEAITDFSQQVYYYTAALQVGTKLIQPSLIDYMR